jgi:uncharacterized protein (DUF2267 family)
MNDQDFLSEVRAAAELPSATEAERWSKAVASALVDLAPDSETRRHLITQLPGFLKSHLRAQPVRSLLMDREAVIQHVGAALDLHAPAARRATLAVWSVIRRAVAPGELRDFAARVPRDVATLLEEA